MTVNQVSAPFAYLGEESGIVARVFHRPVDGECAYGCSRPLEDHTFELTDDGDVKGFFHAGCAAAYTAKKMIGPDRGNPTGVLAHD